MATRPFLMPNPTFIFRENLYAATFCLSCDMRSTFLHMVSTFRRNSNGRPLKRTTSIGNFLLRHSSPLIARINVASYCSSTTNCPSLIQKHTHTTGPTYALHVNVNTKTHDISLNAVTQPERPCSRPSTKNLPNCPKAYGYTHAS